MMKDLSNYIIEKTLINLPIDEKLIINSSVDEKLLINKNTFKKTIEDEVHEWINEWAQTDFEYMMELIDDFLTNGEFESNTNYDEYEPLTKYKDNKEYMTIIKNVFKKFKEDNDKQIDSLKNS